MGPSDDDCTDADSGPFLQEEIMALKDLELCIENNREAEPVQPSPEPVPAAPSPVVQEQKPSGKKTVKPKWLKM